MNALVDLRPHPAATRDIHPAHQHHGLKWQRSTQSAVTRFWRLRPAGEPLCTVDIPDVHAIVFVSPERAALETELRNETARARYDAARHAYRIRELQDRFEALVAEPIDHIAGTAHAVTDDKYASDCVIDVAPSRRSLSKKHRRFAA